MITLNLEKGLVRLASWDDVEGRGGFERDVDAKTVKLKEIIGAYSFDTFQPCGLAGCRQPHGTGYLVALVDGRETNLGNVCGKKHFSIEFVQMRRTFDRALRNAERREFVGAMKNRLPGIAAEVATLKGGKFGATWIHPRVEKLLGNVSGLPTPVLTAVRHARIAGGELVIQRERTAAERAQLAAQAVAGLERQVRIERFIREPVGQLEGFASLTPALSLRALLSKGLDPVLADLEVADVDTLSEKDLRGIHKAASDVDSLLERLRLAVQHGQRLLRRGNLAPLLRFVPKGPDSARLQTFLNGLPE